MTTPSNAFRHYLALICAMGGALLGLAAALNYFVDPYDYFERNTLGVYVTTEERDLKISGLEEHPDDAVLLGTSKAAMIDVSKVKSTTPFYNAGVGGATPEEVVEMAKRVSPRAPLVVVALDFFQYNTATPFADLTFAHRGLLDDINHLFSRQSLGDCFKVIVDHARGVPTAYLPRGLFNADEWRAHNDSDNPAMLARIFDQREKQFSEFRLSEKRLDTLAALREVLDARGKPYVVFINPLVEEDFLRIQHAGVMPAYEQWRARVRAVFPNVVDLAHSSYSDPSHFFRLDPMHFYPETGADILNNEILPRVEPAANSPPPK